MRLREDTEAPHGYLDGPQGEEVLLRQEVVGSLDVSHLKHKRTKEK